MTTTAASRTRRPNLRATFLGGQHECGRSQAATETARRVPGLYWVKFNPDEDWVIARYGLTVVSGQPGWELIGLPCAISARGDEEVQPVPRPVSKRAT
jgi:hypothetical protein